MCRMRAAVQIMIQPQILDMDVPDNEWRWGPISGDNVWVKPTIASSPRGPAPQKAHQADPKRVAGTYRGGAWRRRACPQATTLFDWPP
jgi:hypothetical protein